MPLQLNEIQKFANDCLDNFLDINDINTALYQININPAHIPQNNSQIEYIKGVVQYLDARGHFTEWLEKLVENGIVFAKEWHTRMTSRENLDIVENKPQTKKPYLDEHPVDWTRAEINQLRDLFISAYDQKLTAKELADSTGIVAGTFPIAENMRRTWYQLINEIAKQGKLRSMTEKAAEDVSIGSYQKRFQEMLSANPPISTLSSQKKADWWKEKNTSQKNSRIHFERLIAKRSRLFDIDLARQVAKVSRSVAKLNLQFENKNAYGTGFLIQPNLILTNYHNLKHEEYGCVLNVTAEFDYENIAVENPLVTKGKMDTIQGESKYDWAVFQLEKVTDRDPISLGTPFHIAKQDHVVVVQHPLGTPKKFALDPLSIQYVDEEKIQYLADTQQGSSGAPVFNIQMHLIALHHAEAEVDIEIGKSKETVWRNEGIHIDKVIDGLRTHNIPFNHRK
ncbi:trypsin-like peptidase domain-containing protein [Candidatus Uabimicrobium sp. HlEnr_7]|uniref:trypsin-like peptidase domain-containing protein n=1 Tax=Candidatus Uabimicrobium helgolandensis TaxID=3095367 RepID=UPI00355663A0